MTGKNDTEMEKTILREAERLFLEKGFALTSTTEIAKAAGCNQALIHYYYRTKEQLFAAIFEDKIRLLFEDLSVIEEASMSFEDVLRRVIEAHFDLIRANPRLPFLVMNELLTNPARVAELKVRLADAPKAELFYRMEARLAAEIEAGRVRPMGILDLVIDFVSLNVMYFLAVPILTAVRGLGDAEVEEMTEARRRENVELVLRGIRP